MTSPEPTDEPDYYFEGEYLVFTAAYHRRRGYCCNSRCRNCPFTEETEHEAGGENDETR